MTSSTPVPRPPARGAATPEEPDRLPVVVLDLDGTLVDSVYQHVAAWQAAFHDIGMLVPGVRIHGAIGMGGDRLVSHVGGEAAEDAVGDELRERHEHHFRTSLRSVSGLDGATDLVEHLVSRGHRVALASSSPADLVDDLLERVDVRAHLSALVTGSDGTASKPAPDSVLLALARAGGGRAVVVGDSVWDALAADAAGAVAVGLRSGGIGAARLQAAGATRVHDGPRELLEWVGEHGPLAPPA